MKVWKYGEGWNEVSQDTLNVEVAQAMKTQPLEQTWFEQYRKDVEEPIHNYSKQGWEGQHYQKFKDVPLKDIAAKIKLEALAKYPKITVSVRTKHFSGGCSIDLTILSAPFKLIKKKCIYPEMANLPDDQIPKYAWGFDYLPEAKAVLDDLRLIVNQYNFDDSDGMIDYFSNRYYGSVDYDWKLLHSEEAALGIL